MQSRRIFLQTFLPGFASFALAFPAAAAAFAELLAPSRALFSTRGEAVWPLIRRSTLLDPEIAHLNTGTLGACLLPIYNLTEEAWRHLERNPARFGFGEAIAGAEAARERAAAFLGAGKEEVAFTNNTTEGMNLIAQAMPLRRGDVVLTTNHEHPGGYVGWEYFCQRAGAAIERIDLDDQFLSPAEIVDRFARKITPRTRVISVAHVLFSTGLRMPIGEIAALARAHQLFLAVDGAQGPGMLRVDVKALGCDSYASSSHKWLLAPKGSGLLYLRKERQAEIEPMLLAGGFGAYTAHTGTRNFPALAGHGAAIEWQQALGPERIEQRVLALARYVYDKLRPLRTIKLLRPQSDDADSGMLAFSLTAGKNSDLTAALGERGLVVKTVPMLNAIRISTHIYNNEDEIDRLLTAMQELGVK